jgi:hypothetical protein
VVVAMVEVVAVAVILLEQEQNFVAQGIRCSIYLGGALD